MNRLRKLLEQIPELQVMGSKEIAISGLSIRSDRVAPGNLFIARKGIDHDGAKFLPEAVQLGASCVLTDLYDPFLPVTQLIHPDLDQMAAKLAHIFYQKPSEKIQTIGITGTNGKTTTSYLARYILEKEGITTGLIGSIEWIVGNHSFHEGLTTPDVVTNHKLLHEMVVAGCQVALMEVTSHGIDQNRVGEIAFESAVFTNLSQDHLDYHKNMEAYAATKAKLFSKLAPGKTAIINLDDPASVLMKADTVLTFGTHPDADFRATDLKLSDRGSTFTLTYLGQTYLCKIPLIGAFNVSNALAALAICSGRGISLDKAIHHIKTAPEVPGRMQRVKNRLGVHIFVDFAHTHEALENALVTLKSLKKGRLYTVFGAGGDRDQDKRPKMGQVVATHSDHTIITSDNPRTEDPEKIAREILSGFPKDSSVMIELDRKAAIQKVLSLAHPGDIVLIAGKGHENEQKFAHYNKPFCDVAAIKEFI